VLGFGLGFGHVLHAFKLKFETGFEFVLLAFKRFEPVLITFESGFEIAFKLATQYSSCLQEPMLESKLVA
jgi:hypothetical protein